jgi:hypothetical protein
MIFPWRNVLWVTAVFSGLLSVPAFAQVLTNGFASHLPPVPMMKSPVDIFRDLLAKTPLERRQSLSNRPPEVQKRLLAKVREYESLKPNDRELRLRATELQWYLQPLMSLAPADRQLRLSMIPEEHRKLVEECPVGNLDCLSEAKDPWPDFF